MGIYFLVPLLFKNHMKSALLFAIILHLGLVVFRSISFMKSTNIAPFTYQLAAGEWVIFLVGLELYYFRYLP